MPLMRFTEPRTPSRFTEWECDFCSSTNDVHSDHCWHCQRNRYTGDIKKSQK